MSAENKTGHQHSGLEALQLSYQPINDL